MNMLVFQLKFFYGLNFSFLVIIKKMKFTLFKNLITFIGNIPLSESMLVYSYIVVFSLSLLYLVLKLAFINFRSISQIPFITAILVFFSGTAFKVLCNFFVGNNYSTVSIIFCLFIFFLCNLFVFISSLFKTNDFSFLEEENRLIDGFLNSNDLSESISERFFESPKNKTVEHLSTDKLYGSLTSDDFIINYNQILSYVQKLKTKNLPQNKLDYLFELEKRVFTYSKAKISSYEIKDLSNRLCVLINFISDYLFN